MVNEEPEGILIVEPDRVVAQTLQRMLENQGFPVLAEAASAAEAAACLTEQQPALILMDIGLDQVEGITATETIRKHCEAPVVYLAGWTDPEILNKAKHAGAEAFLLKPVSADDLQRVVEMALSRYKRLRELRSAECHNRIILEAIPDILVRISIEGMVLSVSLPPGPERPERQVVEHNRHIREIVGQYLPGQESVAEGAIRLVQKAIESGEIQYDEHEVRVPGFPLQYVESRYVRLNESEALVLTRDVTRQKITEARLMELSQQTEENERRRFARDLHDGLGQMLSAIRLQLSVIPCEDLTPAQARPIEQSLDLLNTAMEEVRNIAHGLMPALLDEFGLKAALADLCAQVNPDNGLKVGFQAFGDFEGLPQRIQLGLFRVAQEILSNAVQHSAATVIEMQLFRHEDSLVLMVEDNGSGLTESEQLKGLGIGSIHSRIQSLHGDVQIESEPGKGVEYTVEIPLIHQN